MTTRLDAGRTQSSPTTVLEMNVDAMQCAASPEVARLPGIATQLIGERIRAMYASMTREPVPDALLDLVRELDNKERAP